MSDLTYNSSGTTRWVDQNGRLHREGGPAEIYANGDQLWWLNGKLHREGGPAIENHDGQSWWYFHGIRADVHSQQEFEALLPFLRIQQVIDE